MLRCRRSEHISIHPPREGWDLTYDDLYLPFKISIHPPREGWDYGDTAVQRLKDRISIHPPREGWDDEAALIFAACAVFQSTHPVRGGTVLKKITPCPGLFQSTHPVRGGTKPPPQSGEQRKISIHPPREGWDGGGINSGLGGGISIHPPREGWDTATLPHHSV